MSFPHFDLVQRAHNELRSEGLIGPRTSQDQVEQDKGLLTRRAAYYCATERDATLGLLEKTEGNNSLGYSVDWILRSTDGTGWDVATDDGTNAIPMNGGPYDPDPAYIPRWRPATAELAQLPAAPPQPGPTPPADDTAARLAALEAAVLEQTAAIDRLRTQGYHGNCKLGLDMNFGMLPADAAAASSAAATEQRVPATAIEVATLEAAIDRIRSVRDRGDLTILIVG